MNYLANLNYRFFLGRFSIEKSNGSKMANGNGKTSIHSPGHSSHISHTHLVIIMQMDSIIIELK